MGPPQGASGRGPLSDADKKGSVRRAREMLEAGSHRTPPEARQPPTKSAHHSQWPLPQSQWPLPPAGIQPPGLNNGQDLRFLAPSGPPPKRPPRPSEVPLAVPRASQIPSPSVYSERSGNTPEPNIQSQNPGRHRTFSLPGAPLRPSSRPTSRPLTSDGSVSPTSTADMTATPRISVATENTSRHSFSSASSMAVPFISAPRPQQRRPADRSNANLAPPNARLSNPRRCSVSPIPEEHSSASERGNTQDYGSTGVFPASWGSGPAESEILGAYLEDDSDTDVASVHDHPAEDEPGLVRSASLGKRQKPTVRTITKSPATSDASLAPQPTPSVPPLNAQMSKGAAAGAAAMNLAVQNRSRENVNPTQPSPLSRVSTSSQSGESYVDPAKPRIAKPSQEENRNAWEKEMGGLPMAAPTMSDKRPGGRKPPRLDMGAVRDAEKRGSLSSMTDLIRRATRLASNLEHGRTASKANALDVTPGADLRDLGLRGRRSGSLSDILASFPNPSVITPEVRGSWPVFFGRANTRGEPLSSYDETSPEKEKPAKRKCCGIPRRWFIVLCIVIFIIVVLAVLLPVFLVAVPRENAKSTDCASTKPCKNGGVSVSSGSECSCVCAGGFTGSQCTHSGDTSCVTSSIDSGSVHNNATMGSSIPSILDQSQEKFNIELDPVTIMALFSMGNISCRTENALVSFNDVNIDEGSKRRSVDSDLTETETPTSVLVVARAEETTNGIVYEGGHHGSAQNGPGGSNDDSGKETTGTDSTADTTTSKDSTATRTTDGASPTKATATGTQTSSAPTTTSTSTKGVPLKVIEFSRAAVLMILQHTGSFSSAQYSETEIQMYLTDSYASAAHPSLDVLGLFTMDFEKLRISTK